MNPRVLIPLVALVLACGAGAAIYVVLSGPVPVEESRTAATPPGTARAGTPVETPPPAAPAPTRRAPAPRADAPAAAEPEPALEAAPTLGTLRIDSDVPGAQVFIDRQFIGTTPVVAQNVAPGRHQLNVTAEGFEGFAESIEVEPGSRDIAIRFREVRLNANLDVIHRHGVGSCRGRLVATPQGLRYETTNRDDTFTSPLLDLETFEVDYLEKNLRVRLRGRQFNFTDPEGNADRLFVFHRDVNTARERLRKGDRPAGG